MAEGQNIKDSHRAPGEQTAKKEALLLPSPLRGEHIKAAEDNLNAVRNEINRDDPSNPFTAEDVYGPLRSVNPSLAMFLEQQAGKATTDADKLLVASTAKIVYSAMRKALDPGRNYEIDTE